VAETNEKSPSAWEPWVTELELGPLGLWPGATPHRRAPQATRLGPPVDSLQLLPAMWRGCRTTQAHSARSRNPDRPLLGPAWPRPWRGTFGGGVGRMRGMSRSPGPRAPTPGANPTTRRTHARPGYLGSCQKAPRTRRKLPRGVCPVGALREKGASTVGAPHEEAHSGNLERGLGGTWQLRGGPGRHASPSTSGCRVENHVTAEIEATRPLARLGGLDGPGARIGRASGVRPAPRPLIPAPGMR
jgi:hypothetical protein